MREKSLGKRDQITLVLKMVQAKYDPKHTLNFRESECQKKKKNPVTEDKFYYRKENCERKQFSEVGSTQKCHYDGAKDET